MAAVDLYVELCKQALSRDADDPAFWAELPIRLPRLRFFLSCRVCNKILRSPMTPAESKCQHTVCKGCVGQRMLLKPACGWCKDYDSFVDNVQLEALVTCYARFCDYVLHFGAKSRPPPATAGAVDVLALLEEGRSSGSDARATVKVDPELALADAAAAKASASPTPAAAMAASSTVDDDAASTATAGAAFADCQQSHRPPGAPANASVASRSPSSEEAPPPPLAASAAPVHAPAAAKAAAAQGTAAAAPSSVELRAGAGGGESRTCLTLAAHQPPRSAVAPGSSAVVASAHHAAHHPAQTPLPLVGRSAAAPSAAGHSVPVAAQQPPSKKAKRLPNSAAKQERRGCGCGTAATNPGTLTCYGQRCPCYSTRRPCVECRCRGCRNPNKAVRISHSSPESENDVEVHVV